MQAFLKIKSLSNFDSPAELYHVYAATLSNHVCAATPSNKDLHSVLRTSFCHFSTALGLFYNAPSIKPCFLIRGISFFNWRPPSSSSSVKVLCLHTCAASGTKHPNPKPMTKHYLGYYFINITSSSSFSFSLSLSLSSSSSLSLSLSSSLLLSLSLLSLLSLLTLYDHFTHWLATFCRPQASVMSMTLC